MSGSGLFDQNIQLLNANLDRRMTNHELMTRNIANIDTPNYKGTGLEFEKQLRSAISGGVLPTTLATTDPGHMPLAEDGAFAQAKGVYMETGPVHIDIEMSKLAENNVMFNTMVTLLSKKFARLKAAIADGGGGN